MFLVFRTTDFQEMRAVMELKEPSKSQVSLVRKCGTWHVQFIGMAWVQFLN